MSPKRRLGAILAAWSLACCHHRDAQNPAPTPVVVFAASSLTDAFEHLAREFEHNNPRADIQLSFAGSQALRLQIEQGASPDLFASANRRHVQALVDADLVTQTQVFAHNELAVIVPRSNSATIDSFKALDTATRIVIGSSEVPIGTYTRRLLEQARLQLGEAFVARVRAQIVSEESNVRLVRAKVQLGEADAAVVYRTDALASDAVDVVSIPAELNVRATCQLARMKHPGDAGLTAEFVDYVLSPAGRRVLRRHGFRTEAL